MPVFDQGPHLWDDLIRWGVVDGRTSQLVPEAQELFAGVTRYDWAIWGLLLLYNERRPVTADLPEEFLQYGVQYAVRDIPRVPFLVGVSGHTVTTTVLAGGEMNIYSDPTSSQRDAELHLQVGKIVLAILDPGCRWPPYPMARVSIPAPDADSIGRRNADPKTRKKETSEAVATLQAAGAAPSAAAALGDLLSQDNVALAQLTASRRSSTGLETAKSNAAGVMFFGGTKTGAVVSYPVRGLDGRQWVNYEPATPENVSSAIEALRSGIDMADPDDIVTR
ncbi:hypothetical protein DQP56_00770 [Mycolicibacter senuensis]|nr:hypothetical protein DQP56_00770 [Mycolicibacter senuensis]